MERQGLVFGIVLVRHYDWQRVKRRVIDMNGTKRHSGHAADALYFVADHNRASTFALVGVVWASLLWLIGAHTDAGVVAGIALLLLGFRIVLRCDREADDALVRWTLYGIPILNRRRMRLSEVKNINLRKVVRKRRFRSNTYNDAYKVTYPVQLRGDTSLTFQDKGSYPRARRLAEQLAQGLNLTLRDTALGKARRRKPGELDLSLGELLKKEGALPSMPPPLQDSPLSVTWKGRAATIIFPAQPMFWPGYVIGVLVPVILMLVFLRMAGAWLAYGVLVPITLYIWLHLLATFMKRKMVLDEQGVHIRWFIFRRNVPWNRVEEVAIDAGTVCFINDKEVKYMPYDFDREQAEYVVALINYQALAMAPHHHASR